MAPYDALPSLSESVGHQAYQPASDGCTTHEMRQVLAIGCKLSARPVTAAGHEIVPQALTDAVRITSLDISMGKRNGDTDPLHAAAGRAASTRLAPT